MCCTCPNGIAQQTLFLWAPLAAMLTLFELIYRAGDQGSAHATDLLHKLEARVKNFSHAEP